MNDGISRNLVFHDQKINLDEKIYRIINEITKSEKNDIKIGIYLGRTPDLVATVYACYLSGWTYIPLDPEHPSARTELILKTVSPDLVVTSKKYKKKIPAQIPTIDIDSLLNSSPVEEKAIIIKQKDIDPEHIVYIIFTSGSTGQPKGVQIPNKAVDNLLDFMLSKPGLSDKDRILSIITVAFDGSVPELLFSCKYGSTLYLLDENEVRDPEAIRRTIDRHDITALLATPTTWQMLIDIGWEGNQNLKALTGAEPLTQVLAEQLLCRCGELWNLYGPTEATVFSTLDKVSIDKSISIGKAIDNTYVYVLDENLNEVAAGIEGNLYIGGQGLAVGYYNQPELTEKMFIPNPFISGEKIYKTGDLVKIDSEGRLLYLGRSDFQVKIRGFRIELEEIEDKILSCKEIKSVVVHPQVIRKGMKELVAYLVENDYIPDEKLVECIGKSLPDYMIPSYFVRLENMPLNSNGKIDRSSLPLPEVQDINIVENLSGFSIKDKLLFCWKKVLRRDDITTSQNFFEIGGNSILAVQLTREIKELCHLSISLGTFFMYPIIDDLVSNNVFDFDEERTIIHLNHTKEGTPLFCLGGIDIYSELAECFEGERPVYGVFMPYEEQLIDHIQRDSIDNWDYISIQGMAKAYLKDIRNFYPTGSCHILGVFIAGLIAFETARQMKKTEGKRGELFILDSHLPHARNLTFIGKIYDIYRNFRYSSGKPKKPKDRTNPEQSYVSAMRDYINDKAIDVFDKTAISIDGDIHLVKALKNVYRRGESYQNDLGWGKFTEGQIYSLELPDDHMGILDNPQVKVLASYIKEKIKKDNKIENRKRSINRISHTAAIQTGS